MNGIQGQNNQPARSPQEQLEIVLDALGDRVIRESGAETHARCPAHDDNQASLCLRAGDRGVVLHCHAGCESGAVLKALRLTWPLVLGPGDRTATGLGSSTTSVAAPRGRGTAPKAKGPVDRGVFEEAYHYLDEVGTLLFGVERRRLKSGDKTFKQWAPDPTALGGRRWKDVAKRTRRVPYRLPELLARPADPIYFVEGEKDADNLAKLGLLATTTPQGADSFEDADTAALDAILTPGRTVRIIPDQDAKGRAYAAKVAQAARDRGCLVEFVTVPAGCKDASDAINAGWGAEDFERAAAPEPAKVERREAPAGPKRACDGRWIIVSAIDQHARIRADAVRILSEVETGANLYSKGGRAYSVAMTDCRVERINPDNGEIETVGPASRAILAPAGPQRVMEEISKYCTFRRVKKRQDGPEMVQAELPTFLPNLLASVPDGLRPVNGLFMGPTYCPATDSIISDAGYYPLHAKILPESVDIRVPETCSQDMAREASERLRDTFRYLPIRREGDGRRVHEARVLLMLITAVMRHSFKPCPLFMVRAASAGSGKTYLAKSIGIIAHGDVPRMARLPIGSPESESEQDKLISSLLDGGESMVVFDNLPAGWELKSTTLDVVITSEWHTMRRLRENSAGAQVGGPNHLMMIATGNNISPASDFTQRCLTIDIDPTEEGRRTAKESDFAGQGDLLEFVRANREKLLRDVMTIIRGWHQAGRPLRDQVDWGSFPGWVKSCVAPVLWATGINPLDGVFEEWEQEDAESRMLGALALTLDDETRLRPATAAQLVERAKSNAELATALCDLMDLPRPEQIAPRSLARRLKAFVRRPIRLDDRTVCIATGTDPRAKVATFHVAAFAQRQARPSPPSAGIAGLAGVNHPYGSRSKGGDNKSTEYGTPFLQGLQPESIPAIPAIPATESPAPPAESISTPASAIDIEAIQRRVKEGLAGLRAKAPVFRGATPADDPADLAGTKLDAMREAIRVSDGDRDRARDLFLASGFTKSDWDHYQPKVSRPEMVAGRVRLVPSA